MEAGAHVHHHGRPVGDNQHPIAYVPQREEIDWGFPVTLILEDPSGNSGLIADKTVKEAYVPEER